MQSIDVGDRIRDPLTGMEGIATARYDYLYGCVRICLERFNDGKIEEVTFDELRLEITERHAVPRPTIPSSPRPISTGGPRDDPHARR